MHACSEAEPTEDGCRRDERDRVGIPLPSDTERDRYRHRNNDAEPTRIAPAASPARTTPSAATVMISAITLGS